jgi:hypothetical protein
MPARHPVPRSHPGRVTKRYARSLSPLPEGRRRVAAFAEENSKWAPMLALYDRLCAACGAQVYGSGIMGGGLVLAARADVEHDEGVILVYFDPKKDRFSIHYRHSDVQPEQSDVCAPKEVWERLRLFLGYKFGIRIASEKKG